MRPDKYILVGRDAVPEMDLLKWADWFENASRRVAFTRTPWHVISTVFLGLDHNYGDEGEPILFETMVLDGVLPEDGREQERYSTWDEAEAGHRAMVEKCRRALINHWIAGCRDDR